MSETYEQLTGIRDSNDFHGKEQRGLVGKKTLWKQRKKRATEEKQVMVYGKKGDGEISKQRVG